MGGGERERLIGWLPPGMHPNQGSDPQPRDAPSLEIKPTTCWSTGHHRSNNRATSARTKLQILYENFFSSGTKKVFLNQTPNPPITKEVGRTVRSTGKGGTSGRHSSAA